MVSELLQKHKLKVTFSEIH